MSSGISVAAWTLVTLILMAVIVASQGDAVRTRADRLRARPNIVFLYTDDQAQWAVGAYGNRDIKTPHLDRLAQQGRSFATRSRSRRYAHLRGRH